MRACTHTQDIIPPKKYVTCVRGRQMNLLGPNRSYLLKKYLYLLVLKQHPVNIAAVWSNFLNSGRKFVITF